MTKNFIVNRNQLQKRKIKQIIWFMMSYAAKSFFAAILDK